MKLFTLKDLNQIYYPCFSCGKINYIYLSSEKKEYIPGKIWNSSTSNNYADGFFDFSSQENFNCQINNGKLISNLINKYHTKLSLQIDCKSHRFISTDHSSLLEFLDQRIIKLNFSCRNCISSVMCNELTFNFSNRTLNPIKITSERHVFVDGSRSFSINSDYDKDISTIYIYNVSSSMYKTDNLLKKEIVCLPIYKFQNKKELINYIDNMIIFS